MTKTKKATIVQVQKKESESGTSLLKRFTRKVQEAKLLSHAKGIRFRKRAQSKLKKKEKAIKRITKQKKTELLKKLGKID